MYSENTPIYEHQKKTARMKNLGFFNKIIPIFF